MPPTCCRTLSPLVFFSCRKGSQNGQSDGEDGGIKQTLTKSAKSGKGKEKFQRKTNINLLAQRLVLQVLAPYHTSNEKKNNAKSNSRNNNNNGSQ